MNEDIKSSMLDTLKNAKPLVDRVLPVGRKGMNAQNAVHPDNVRSVNWPHPVLRISGGPHSTSLKFELEDGTDITSYILTGSAIRIERGFVVAELRVHATLIDFCVGEPAAQEAADISHA